MLKLVKIYLGHWPNNGKINIVLYDYASLGGWKMKSPSLLTYFNIQDLA